MGKQTIKVEVSWSDKNYCGGWGFPGVGAILCTNKTLEGFKSDFEESLRFHVEGMAEDGDDIPQWLLDGNYEIVYELSVSALLRQAERYTTMAALSRETGISQRVLSHYANAYRIPRPEQKRRIVAGVEAIGERLHGMCMKSV